MLWKRWGKVEIASSDNTSCYQGKEHKKSLEGNAIGAFWVGNLEWKIEIEGKEETHLQWLHVRRIPDHLTTTDSCLVNHPSGRLHSPKRRLIFIVF